jgi:hypothetical protein
MPTKQCQNHAQCKGQATDGDHLCQYCRQVANETRREKRIESKLERLEKTPRRLWDVMR